MKYSQVAIYLNEGYPVKLKDWKEHFWIREDNDIVIINENYTKAKVQDYRNINQVIMDASSDEWEIATEDNCPLYTDYIISNNNRNRIVFETK